MLRSVEVTHEPKAILVGAVGATLAGIDPASQSYNQAVEALHDLDIPGERIFDDFIPGRTINGLGWRNLVSVDSLDSLGHSSLAVLQAMEELEQRGVRARHQAKRGPATYTLSFVTFLPE